MDTDQPAARDGVWPDDALPSSLNPRRLSPVPPPPMRVVYKGWWNDRTTLRQAADLEREDRERQGRHHQDAGARCDVGNGGNQPGGQG